MSYLIIEREDNDELILEKIRNYFYVNKFKFNLDKPIIVFDIHNTTIVNGEINEKIYLKILYLIENNFNVVFLSFDGQRDRIQINYDKLNIKPELRNLPYIFMLKREKFKVMEALLKIMPIKDNQYGFKVGLIDDNKVNIKGVIKNLNQEDFDAYLYKYNKDTFQI